MADNKVFDTDGITALVNSIAEATNAKYATKTVATQSANGLLSAADKKKLDGIATGANKYTHPTTTGNKHIPAGGSSGQILKWSADGTAVWSAPVIPVLSADPTNPVVGQMWVAP